MVVFMLLVLLDLMISYLMLVVVKVDGWGLVSSSFWIVWVCVFLLGMVILEMIRLFVVSILV